MSMEGESERRKGTVLVIQDYPPVHLEPMTSSLRRFGYEVLTSFEGRAGLELAVTQAVDLIITDIALRDMSGIELCRRARAHPELKRFPLLLVCSLPRESDPVMAALQAGADDFLRIPCDPVQLLTRVIGLTERRRTEDSARLRENLYEMIVKKSADRMTVLTDEGRTIYESPAAERQTGFKPEELIGKNNFTLIHPDDVNRVMQAETGALIEYRHFHKDGSWRWLESVGQRILDEKGNALTLLNTRDITERKRPS